jgi:DNA-binding GntR family transcriptional regulator
LEPIQVVTLSQRVTERLRYSIFNGILHPGDTLVERVIAEQLHVSQTAVREAFIRLEGEGLLQRFPTRETRVTLMTQEQINEGMRARLLLEPVAFTEAYKHMTPDKVRAARGLITQMEDALRRQDDRRYSFLDLEFHRLFWRLSGDGTLVKLLETACVPLFGFSIVVKAGWRRASPALRLAFRACPPIFLVCLSTDAISSPASCSLSPPALIAAAGYLPVSASAGLLSRPINGPGQASESIAGMIRPS